MARRMFNLKIVDTDEFLDMPPTTQNLYFHLCMRADDDGFVSSPKKIMKIISSVDDDIKVLISKKFVIPFDSGVCVIKHWKIHNLIRQDRYTETEYKKEKTLLIEKNNKYELENGITNDNQMTTSGCRRLGKVRLGKDRLERESTPTENFNKFLNSSNKERINLLEKEFKRKLSSDEKDNIEYFISYWTEKNQSGTKQRWQLERTFDFVRRIGTWFRNMDSFGNNKDKPLIIE